MQVPDTTKALVLRENRAAGLHDVVLEARPLPRPTSEQVVVKVRAVSFNHRDLWIRKGLYPGIAFGSVLGADAVGTVIASGKSSDELLNKRVFLVPMRGWKSSPDAPESSGFGILGGGKNPPLGTFAEYITVDRDQVIPAPDHLDDEYAAAWPLAGVTAWRAVSVNGNIQRGDNVLITGIGGGVALVALQLCLAKGANVYVTSGNEDKIHKAVALGAKGGVNYKNDKWPVELGKLLNSNKAMLQVVIDSGGGNILAKVGKVLAQGGKLVCYGMHAEPSVTFTMREVLKNQKILGSTMGSQKDLIEATNFIAEYKVKPVVSDVLNGLEEAEKGFELMGQGNQFGKIVIKIDQGSQGAKL